MALFIKQLLAGRDFAIGDEFAAQMANFIYLIGDDSKRECMVVDPAWDVSGIIDYIDREDLRLTGALVTHYHPDHIGGSIFGHTISGLKELMEVRPVKIHINSHEGVGVKVMTGVSETDLIIHSGGDRVKVGDAAVTLLHTPGHTPGSQCFLTESSLVSGDTLFIGGCGRVDLPGGNPEELYHSLTQVLARLPEQTLVYPGHNYSSKPVSTIRDEKSDNYYMRIPTLDGWLNLMGRS
jgi:hydroxyacylglutathione hydrolase